MSTLVLIVLFASIFAYFAAQNDTRVDVSFVVYNLQNIPLYMVMLGSALAGVVVAWFIHASSVISSKIKIFGKDRSIQKKEEQIDELTDEIKDLKSTKGKTEK